MQSIELKQLCLLKKWQLIFLYIGRIDWGTRHLTIILGTGDGTFANRRADHLTIFSNARGLSEGEEGGGGGGMLSRSGPGCSKRG